MITTADFTDLWKPTRPYATDNFNYGMKRMRKDIAVNKRFIETNAKELRNLLVLDIDIDNSEWHVKSLIHDDGVIPEPSFVTINPASEHAQVGFFLDGIVRTDKSIQFMSDVAKKLQLVSSGDDCYGGTTMRNPMHPYQRTTWGTDKLYTLNELNGYVKGVRINSYTERKVVEESAEYSGRNDAMFNSLRKWAYRERVKYSDLDSWEIACYERANELNFSFDKPLSPSEVRSIVKSTVSWVWKNFSKETFSKIQSARSKRRDVVKNSKDRDRAIMDMVEAGFSISEIADNLGTNYNAAKTSVRRAKQRTATVV